MNKMTGLGRGLGSLIPTRQESTSVVSSLPGIREVSPASIVENPRQPRRHFSPTDLEDLIASIKEHGILQPLIVTDLSNGSYELIAGERRLRSARMLGLSVVPVIVRTATDQQKLELALIENIQRQDLNAIEEAIAYQALLDEFGLTQEEVAKRVGKSRSALANTLRLLDLAPDMQQAVIEGRITKSHARTLLAATDPAERERLFQAMLTGQVTVREAEARSQASVPITKKSGAKDPNILDHERRLREALGTKVDIQDKYGKGRISISYYSKEELGELLHRLAG